MGGAPDSLKARFRLRIGSLVRDVVVDQGSCRVEAATGKPDAEISTSPSTWLEIEEGKISGVEAFAQRRLTIRGSIQRALEFEPLFARPDAGGFRYRVERVKVGDIRISTLFAGEDDAPPLLMMHGLGATKASLLPIVPELARHRRVMVVDLPGFGSSSKPRGRYDAPWFAERMFAFLDSLGIRKAALIGNSMGGRIAQEMGLMEPKRIEGMGLLCPATAFSYRPGLPLVKVLRPELGVAVGYMPRKRVTTTMRSLFAKPGRIDPAWYEAAADDFLRTWRSPRARMAFFAAVRNIYLEEPYGKTGFFTRLASMKPPAFYIYGKQDVLITPHFARKIRGILPNARVELWDDCGHTPQLEYSDRTAEALLDFFGDSGRKAAVG